MNKIIREIREIEFEKIRYDEENEDYFATREGNIPILISAPHGAKHLRNDTWKEEDEYTSSIAIKLAEATGAHCIYVKNRTTEDPNFIKKSKYKDKVRNIINDHQIKFLLDIHGAGKKRPFNICVGTRYDEKEQCSCPTFKSIIENSLKSLQKPPLFNRPYFKARKSETVTSFAREECGIESAQIEINANFRIVERKMDSVKAVSGAEPFFKAEERDILILFDHLRDMILKIREKIEG
jgi:hypothetical protein